MRKLNFVFALLVCVSFGSASVAYDLTAPSGEDTAMVIYPGSPQADYGIVVTNTPGSDGYSEAAIYGRGLNGGVGILGKDAIGVVAHGYSSYPAISAEQHGTSTGIYTIGYTHGIFAEASTNSNPIGVQGNAFSGSQPVGVKGTASSSDYYNDIWGVQGEATSANYAQNAIGVGGFGAGTDEGWVVGVWGDAEGGGDAWGVYGSASNANYNNYAGWFNGDVNVTGSCNCYPSDEKLKKNVRPLDKGLSTVMALRPKAYDMKVEEYNGKLNLAKGPQLGMIAQDVEKLVPEAVTNIKVPARDVKTADGKVQKVEEMEYKSLNYIALVPILIKAIQELEAKVAVLEKAK